MTKMMQMKALRLEKNLTLKEVAKYCDVAVNVVRMWESGRYVPRHYNYTKLQEIYNAKDKDLFEIVEVEMEEKNGKDAPVKSVENKK